MLCASSWKLKCWILLMHGVSMKFILHSFYTIVVS